MYRDHVMAASGYGGGECHCGTKGGGSGGQTGINDIAALAAGAVAGFLLFRAITMAAARRRKRDEGSYFSSFEIAKDILYAGKIEKIVFV
jgi:hypothetical protein